MRRPQITGLIFDLDGTLVDSGLDFDLMRHEMGLPAGRPILEAIDRLSDEQSECCREILARHEWEGARRATVMPGALEFLAEIERLGIHRALLTRNSRAIVEATLARLGLEFELIVAREDAPAKPDPTAIRQICACWRIAPEQVAIIGDYRFDLEAGRAAGIRTVLYTRGRTSNDIAYANLADYLLSSFHEIAPFRAWLSDPA